MPKITLLARLSDGLPLAASMADENDAYAKELETYERQAKKLVRTLSSSATSSPPSRDDEYVTVESGSHFCFHYTYKAGNDLVLLTLTEKAYPKRLAFDYLDELNKEFVTSYGGQIATASRPYQFIRFDTFIQKTKKVYNDSKTQRNLHKLNSQLKDVHSIMTRNINDVISRGERLENVAQKSTRLSQESKRYAKQAKHANRMRVVRQYMPIALVFLIVALVWLVYRKL